MTHLKPQGEMVEKCESIIRLASPEDLARGILHSKGEILGELSEEVFSIGNAIHFLFENHSARAIYFGVIMQPEEPLLEVSISRLVDIVQVIGILTDEVVDQVRECLSNTVQHF